MTPAKFRSSLEELKQYQRVAVSSSGLLFIPRMVRDEDIRARRAAGGKRSIGHPHTNPPKAKEGDPSIGNNGYPLNTNEGGVRSDSVFDSSSVLELPIKQETQSRATVFDLNGQISQRFDEFWSRYPRQVGKDSALRDWLSVALAKDEPAIFACLENYLASAEVAHGAVMNAGSTPRGFGWIIQCAREHWECRWPAAPVSEDYSEPRLMFK
jgi:hypothetical protein